MSTNPENTRINSPCSVDAQTTLISSLNIYKTLILKTSVIDGDIVVKADTQTIDLGPEDQIKTVTSINFSPSVLIAKDYLIKTEIFEGTTKLTQGETTFHVLPAKSPTRVDVSQSMDKPVLYPGQDCVTTQFKLIGEGTPETPQRNPIDIILCIDDSGSMEWGNDDWSITKPWRIDFAKEASIHVIDLLQTNDRGAVVEFAGSTWIQQNITYDKPLLKTKISKTPASPWDGTSIGRGLQSANSILSTNSSDARSKVIVLLSDGGENVWTLSSVINQANIAKQNGYQIYTIGLGAGADQNLLSTLANITGGKYVYSPTMEQLDQMMTELAGEIFDTAGKNVILETTIPLNGMTVDTTKIVPAPTTSTYNSDGSMTLNWTFDKLVMGDEKIFEIYYEGTNLISGKEVILTKNTKLTYQDGNGITVTENLEDLKIPVNECMLDSKVVTDKTSYTVNENVNITNVVQNLTDHPSTINGKVEIVDNKGTIVETIPETETNTWAAGETKTIDFTWNTGLTMAGTYKARISWSEGEKIISASEVSFEIISDATVSCKISVDKLNYSANEDVNISETIQNNSVNNIESQLTIRTCLYNSKGEQVWNSEDTLLELLPTDHTILKNVWNTAKNVPDQYIMVMEVYKNNIKLTENNTIFEISSDMEGVSEISGSLKVLKNNCYPSDNVGFSYEIYNTGNVKLNDITARIRIIDTSSETILDTITDKINIDISSSVAAQKIWMHDALKTGVYMVVLDAILADGDEVTLGSGYINVENPYDTTISQVVRPRVLVWAESQNNINLANQTLEEMQVYYNVVSSREAFMTELRTKKYTLYMLLDSSLPLTGDEDKELAAEVAQGKGIIASRDSNGDNLKNLDLFGVSFNGSTTPGDYTVSFQNDSVFNQFTLSGTGKAQTITLDGGQQLATLYSKKGTSPAVVTNNYQNGKSILFTFDIGSCSGELTNIMKKSIELVSPSSELIDSFAEIEVKVHALTSIRAKISLNIPQGAEVIWTSPDTSMWEFDAIEGQDYIFRCLLELPQIAGQYPVILDSYYESSAGILKFETNEVNLLKQ